MPRRNPINLMEAVDTLSTIADLEDLGEGMELMTRESEEVADSEQKQRTIRWLQEHDADQTMGVIRACFSLVDRYLRRIHRAKWGTTEWPMVLKNIKSIMALVGEAAQKVEHFTHLFYGVQDGSILGMEEYHHLQEFYHRNIEEVSEAEIAKASRAQFSRRYQQELLHPIRPEQLESFERILRDLDYELFYLRGDDGNPFMTPSLQDSVKLACDFGTDLEAYTGEDPLIHVMDWHDGIQQKKAEAMWEGLRPMLDRFYSYPREEGESDFTIQMDFALMALKLAADPDNRLLNVPLKACHRYFSDFLRFYRSALETRDCQRLMLHPDSKGEHWLHYLTQVTSEVARQLYLQEIGSKEARDTVLRMIQKGRVDREAKSTADWLRSSTVAMQESLRQHPNGPLFKILDLMREKPTPSFDPMRDGNLPGKLFDWVIDSTRIGLVRLPSPTRQELVDQADISSEFLAYLHSGTSHLMLNLQDRSAWKEEARAKQLEELNDHPQLSDHLSVITLAVDSDFYHQLGPWEKVSGSRMFIDGLLQELEGPNYYFPEQLRQMVLNFAPEAASTIHRLFFHHQKRLSRVHRQLFIDLFHLMLTCKLISVVTPAQVSFICKDGIDTSTTHFTALFALMKVLSGASFTSTDQALLQAMLFMPALLFRERSIEPTRLGRLADLVELFEQAVHESHERGQWEKWQTELSELTGLDLPGTVSRSETNLPATLS